MPRFVVLQHDSPRGLHWDFMLEMGDSLATWALGEPPDSPGSITAERLPDHRPAYLDYEGPVSGNRGDVARWDQGTYEVECATDAEVAVSLKGSKLQGRARFQRVADGSPSWAYSFGCNRRRARPQAVQVT